MAHTRVPPVRDVGSEGGVSSECAGLRAGVGDRAWPGVTIDDVSK